MDLATRFVAHLRQSGLLAPGARVTVACSGGADSVALLFLLARSAGELGIGSVSVAHLDHGLRHGSAEDERFVVDLAARLGVALVTARVPVRRRRGESPEEAARRVRYGFLARAARSLGADVVVTAHHCDDQAETVLYRAVRGTGIDGLAGVLPDVRFRGSAGTPAIRVVRPLLPFRRTELRTWLAGIGESWREDPTNVGGNDRAILRNRVLPLIQSSLGRDPVPPLARLATLAQRAASKSPRPPVPASPTPTASPVAPASITWERRRVGTALFLERLGARPGSMELLAASGVRGALHVRHARRGDRFHALGLPKPQRLGHYLQRRGVPAASRATVPLLCDDDGIVWVVGHGIAARAALGIETRFAWVAKRV